MENQQGKVLNTYRTQYFSISKILDIIDMFNTCYPSTDFKTYTIGNLSFYIEYQHYGMPNDPLSINHPKNPF